MWACCFPQSSLLENYNFYIKLHFITKKSFIYVWNVALVSLNWCEQILFYSSQPLVKIVTYIYYWTRKSKMALIINMEQKIIIHQAITLYMGNLFQIYSCSAKCSFWMLFYFCVLIRNWMQWTMTRSTTGPFVRTFMWKCQR